ncbi:hypothetical protein NHX12_034384 [Muraenolepis orangiensis]|uniref:Uncharacterized protein n=1 Tax=Muraenolepis orangiensis TaxID=630683 RepID=A0A9Q0D6Q0_9TELE|nr:hypothetical protein NHX12_034384 [Muraenolepis orangiensis]
MWVMRCHTDLTRPNHNDPLRSTVTEPVVMQQPSEEGSEDTSCTAHSPAGILVSLSKSSQWTAGAPSGHQELPVDSRSSQWTAGAPSGQQELPVDSRSSQWTAGAPSGQQELPVDSRSSQWTAGAPSGQQELPVDSRSP